MPKTATSPKVCVCTTLGNLKCQIESTTKIIKCTFERLSEERQTCLAVIVSVTLKKSHVFITTCAQNVDIQHQRKRVDADANSTFNNRVTESDPLAVDASLQFVDVRDLGTIDSLLEHTPHGVVNRVEELEVR